MKNKMFENPNEFTTVCVDSFEDHVVGGRFCTSHQEEVPFRGLMPLFLHLEQWLDERDAARVGTGALQTASDTAQMIWGGQDCRGKEATFVIKVLFRQNASWQGSVLWVEEGQEESFRSELELTLLISSALEKE